MYTDVCMCICMCVYIYIYTHTMYRERSYTHTFMYMHVYVKRKPVQNVCSHVRQTPPCPYGQYRLKSNIFRRRQSINQPIQYCANTDHDNHFPKISNLNNIAWSQNIQQAKSLESEYHLRAKDVSNRRHTASSRNFNSQVLKSRV